MPKFCPHCGKPLPESLFADASTAEPVDGTVFEYERYGYKVLLYSNRLSIVQKAGLMPAKEDILLLKSIASVDVSRMSKELTITLNDGTARKVKIYGQDALNLRDAIAARL